MACFGAYHPLEMPQSLGLFLPQASHDHDNHAASKILRLVSLNATKWKAFFCFLITWSTRARSNHRFQVLAVPYLSHPCTRFRSAHQYICHRVLQGTERTARRKNVKIVYWPNVLATSLVMSSAIGQNQSMPDQIIHCWLCEVSCWLRAAISWPYRGHRCLCYSWASKITINRKCTENSLDDICQHCSVNLCRQNTFHSCVWIKNMTTWQHAEA